MTPQRLPMLGIATPSARTLKFPFIVVMPNAGKTTMDPCENAGPGMAALEQSIREFHGDRDRPISRVFHGRLGTWDMTAKYPGKFAHTSRSAAAFTAANARRARRTAAIPTSLIRTPRRKAHRFHSHLDFSWRATTRCRGRVSQDGASLQAPKANVVTTEYPGVGP